MYMKKTLSLFMIILTVISFNITSIQNVSADSNGLLIPTRHRAFCLLSKAEQAEIEKEANKLLENVSLKASNYEKLMFVTQRLKNTYSSNVKHEADAYGAIVLKAAVCSGKADGISYLLDKLNVPNIVVGAVETNHAWNLVKMDDGKWYHFDETQDYFLSEQEYLDTQRSWGHKNFKSSHITCCDDRGMIKKKYRAQTEKERSELYKKVIPSGMRCSFLDADGYFYCVEDNITAKEYSEGKYPKLCRWRNGKKEVVADSECMANYFKDTEYEEYGWRVYEKCGDFFNINCVSYNIKTREKDSGSILPIHKNFYSVDVKPTYSEYGTNSYCKCKDCGNVFIYRSKKGGSMIDPLPLTKPVVKYSRGKKSVTLKFENKYYAEKWFAYSPSSGYQIKWRKVGEKRWKSSRRLSAKKQINRTIKSLKSKKKYQFKVRYYTISGDSGRPSGRFSYGPWSKVKKIKAR